MFEFEQKLLNEHSLEKLHRIGVQAVIFDFDDTLIYTSEIFNNAINEYVDIVSEQTGIDNILLNVKFQEQNDEVYRKMGVSPNKWNIVIDRLAQEFGNSEIFKNNASIIMEIYTKEPRVRPGAKSILEGLSRSGLKIGMVTHAS